MVRPVVLAACCAATLGRAPAQEFTIPDASFGVPIQSFVTGDTNGDGLLDALGSGGGGSHLLLGSHGGGFGEPLFPWSAGPPPVPSTVRALADVTGDGRDDLLLTTPEATELIVAPALADGTFGALVASTVQAGIGGIATTDADGDGLLDVWYGESTGQRAHLLRSLGDGTFEALVDVATPPRNYDLAVGDVTGDGLDDVVTLSRGASFTETIPAVAAALPGGGFATSVVLDEPAEPVANLRVVDVDGDGVDDVACKSVSTIFTPPGTPLGVVYVGGPDVVTAAPQPLSEASVLATDWQLADVDADGLADLVVLDPGSGRVIVRRQLGGLLFDDGLGVGVGPFTALRVDVADADLDGALDVVTASTRGTLRVSHGQGDGTFTPTVMSAGSPFPTIARLGDVDGDGLDDLVTVTSSVASGAVYTLRAGRLGAGFGPPVEIGTTAEPATALAVVDVEGDGDLDVVAGLGGLGATVSGVATSLNDGGVLGAPVAQVTAGSFGAAVVADVTGDGLVDVTLFPTASNGGDVLRFEGVVAGLYALQIVGPIGSAVADAVAAEVDGVPPLDVVAAIPFFAAPPAIVTITPSGIAPAGDPVDVDATVIAAGDFDGDGLSDLVAGRDDGAGFEVRLNDGAGNYVVSSFVGDTLPVAAFDVRDLDGDGDDDVVAAERGSASGAVFARLSVWLSDGSGDLAPGDVTELEQFADDVALADVDDDGLVDALVTSGTEVVVLPNVDASWTPLGQSLAGRAGFSRLDGYGPLTSGGDVVLEVSRAVPSSSGTLVIGFAELAAPLAGGVLVPSPDVLVTGLVTDASGDLVVPATLPAGVPADVELLLQFWQASPGGLSATTAVRGVTR